MKKHLLTLFAVFLSLAAAAQSAPKFGVRGGINLAKFRTVNNDNNTSVLSDQLSRIMIGGYLDFRLGSGFSFQPGLELSGKGSKTIFVQRPNVNYQSKIRLTYLQIPLNFLYHVPAGIGKVYIGGGPYAAYGISGKSRIVGTANVGGDVAVNVDSERKLNFGSSPGDDYKFTDYGFNFLGGFQFKSGFNLGINYGLGLSDIIPRRSNSPVKTNNRVLGLSAGFFF
ncbi:MAG: PorT family protein [Mucilaginibacter polytrichastri]|nr:PorT family protein [Mucilaginibacter polytrichastri]